MRALIIGTGSIGQRHIRNIQKLVPDTRFVILRKDARRDDLSSSLNATVVGSIKEAISLKPNFAVVATPSALHFDVLVPLIEAHLPIYIEKPVVTRREDVDTLYSLMQRTAFKGPTLVGCNLRFLPSIQKIRGVLQERSLGKVVRAGFTAGQWLPDWRPNQDYKKSYSSNSQLGGGVVFDLIHELDIARWLFGEFERVGSLTGSFSSLSIESEDTAAIVMGKSEGPPAVTIQLDYISRKPVRRYEVVGDQGSLVFDLPAKTLTLSNADGPQVIDCGEDGFDTSKTYEFAMQEFLEAVRMSTPTSQDILDGLKSVELAILARERKIS